MASLQVLFSSLDELDESFGLNLFGGRDEAANPRINDHSHTVSAQVQSPVSKYLT
jgi:hypothetical protein